MDWLKAFLWAIVLPALCLAVASYCLLEYVKTRLKVDSKMCMSRPIKSF